MGAQMRKKVLVVIVLFPLIMLLSTFLLEDSHSLELASNDCVKCHPNEVRDVGERGGLHKTEVGCLDCHKEHPPHGEQTIATCDSCHASEDHAHYAVQDCKTCHYPHHPVDIDFAKMDELKTVCLTCHSDQVKEMEAHPSEHAEQDCKECHTAHGEATACMKCHDPHTEEMSNQDCLRCHKPHMPTAIRFDGVVSSALCSGCHEDPVLEIEERGAAHQDVGCIDCHRQHPPSEKGVIPGCAMCHGPEDASHYALENCSSCHPPHYPLEMDFAKMDEVRPVCLTCHSDQGQEMDSHPSEHAEQDCKECHTAHGEATACGECHDPHAEEMTDQDCLRCHKPHMPADVTYEEDIPSPFCIACHHGEGKDLAETMTKHHLVGCVYCHENKHKTVLQCGICHGEPHDFDIHAKYPDCLKCHKDPHRLFN